MVKHMLVKNIYIYSLERIWHT